MSTFILGDTNAICDVCGFEFKGSQLKKRWDGAMVCDKDFELRHPLDSLKARSERQNVRNARPVPEHRFLATNEVQPEDL